jgi:squalene cyclase
MPGLLYAFFNYEFWCGTMFMKKVSQNAVTFLINSRNSEGLWSDFRVPRESDEWVTAYIGTILAGTENEDAMNVARKAWDVFGSRNVFTGHGGWAYNRFAPEDADSTAWGIKFALKMGLKGKLRTRMAENFLQKHITPNGGLATYILEKEVRKLMYSLPEEDVSGWMSPHPCISAAAAVLPSFNELLIPFLIENQLSNGSWGAYWCSDTIYTTAYAVEALMINGKEKNGASIDRAMKWIIDKFDFGNYFSNNMFPSGSPFATALALRSMALTNNSEIFQGKMEEVSNWLIDQQRADGSWVASTTMLFPRPSMQTTYNFGEMTTSELNPKIPVILDQNSTFTTATVLDSLLTYNKLVLN